MVVAENFRPVGEDVGLRVDLVEAGPEEAANVRPGKVVHPEQRVDSGDDVCKGLEAGQDLVGVLAVARRFES